jgi:hypothetical protein
MDYTNLLKRNFITLMNKNYAVCGNDPEMIHKANAYANTLLQLPCHPILSEEDVKHLQIPDLIRSQMRLLMETNRDLDEVTDYLSDGGGGGDDNIR